MSEYTEVAVQAEAVLEDRQPESMSTDKKSDKIKSGFKFRLEPNLKAGQSLSKTKDEEILYEWKYDSEALTLAEWFATYLTLGIYYFITRIYIRRRRFYTLSITNSRFIFKEEMFESIGFCCGLQKLLENQFSYMHSDLAFVSYEYTKDAGCLEMRFRKFPEWTDLSDTIYESRIGWFIRFTKNAFKTAFNDTYGIDLELPPLQRIMAIILAGDKLGNYMYAILFGLNFTKQLIIDMIKNTIEMIKAAFIDPSVGSLQVLGVMDSSAFRFVCTKTEDPGVHEKIAQCVKWINRIALEKNSNFLPNFASLDKFTAFENVAGDEAKTLNDATIQYRVHEKFCPLAENETILIATANNLKWTCSMILNCISTFGVYYLELVGTMAHRESVVVTNKRIIRHSQLVSQFTGLDHYRIDAWLFPEKPNASFSFTTMKDSDGNYDLYLDCGAGVGLFTINMSNLEFLYDIAKVVSTTIPMHPAMTAFSTHEEDIASCKKTVSLLSQGEKVEIAVCGKIPADSWWDRFFFCLDERDCIVLTNKGVYIEGHVKKCYKKKKSTVSFLSYADLQGVYWSNFQSRAVSSLCPCFALDVKYDEVHGYNGLRLYISVKGGSGLNFGVRLPSRYYGVSDLPVTSLVDSINYAMLERVQKDAVIIPSDAGKDW